jgi:hypothetical protein
MKATSNTEIAPVSPLNQRKITVINDVSPRYISSPKLLSPRNKTMLNPNNQNLNNFS